jgi:cell division protein FtsN
MLRERLCVNTAVSMLNPHRIHAPANGQTARLLSTEEEIQKRAEQRQQDDHDDPDDFVRVAAFGAVNESENPENQNQKTEEIVDHDHHGVHAHESVPQKRPSEKPDDL